MTDSNDAWIDILRREAAIVVAQMQFKGTLVCTGFNPQTYSVKGILMPHEVETGWLPIGGGAVGDGFGDVWGPKVGSSDSLDGDQFSVHFDTGDANAGFTAHRMFSSTDNPPQVQEGEMMRKAQFGQQLFFDMDGNATLALDNGAKVKLKKNGDAVAMPKPGAIYYTGGDPEDGGTFDWVMTVSGPSTTHKAKVG